VNPALVQQRGATSVHTSVVNRVLNSAAVRLPPPDDVPSDEPPDAVGPFDGPELEPLPDGHAAKHNNETMKLRDM
jgi:hypothetical protein